MDWKHRSDHALLSLKILVTSHRIFKNTQALTSLGVTWFCLPLSPHLLQSNQGREEPEGFWPQGICTCCPFYLVHACTLSSYGLLKEIFLFEISSQISLCKRSRESPNLRKIPPGIVSHRTPFFFLIPGPNSYLLSYLLKVCLTHQRMRLEASVRIFFFLSPCGDPHLIYFSIKGMILKISKQQSNETKQDIPKHSATNSYRNAIDLNTEDECISGKMMKF